MNSIPLLRALKTTLIGGLIFLLPLIVVLAVVGQGLGLAAKVIEPIAHLLPFESLGGIGAARAAAVALLVAACFGAGLLARAAVGRALSSRFEDRLLAVYPRYTVIRAMSQGFTGEQANAVLKPVRVRLDDQAVVAFEVERLADGQVVVFLPGAPDVWSGTVAFVQAERVTPLGAEAAALVRCLQGLGRGIGTVLVPTTP